MSITKTAAIYARISEKSKTRDKVADQIEQCRAFAARRGYVVVAVFEDDGITGMGTKTRPGWDLLLEGVAARRFDVLIATEEERFARNLSDKVELQFACIDSGVVWETIRDGFVDPGTEGGEFFSTMRAAMGRMESRRKASRQRAANVARAADGLPVPGRRRFGYEGDNITPRESEAETVRAMFRAFGGGVSIRAITLDLKAHYPAPSTGVEWTPRRVRDTLNNPAYGGLVRHKGAILPGVVIPIVEPELAANVRLMLADPTRRTSPGSAVKHLLSNFATCGVCGARLIYMRSYRCRESSAHVSILKPLLDEPVRRAIVAALQFGHPDMLGDPVAGATVNETLRAHKRVLEAIEETMRREDEGLLTSAQARSRLSKLKRERESIEAALEHAQRASAAARVLVDLRREVLAPGRVDLDGAVELRGRVADRFDALDIEQQRELLRSLVEVTVHKGRTAERIEIVHTVVTSLNADPENIR